MIIKVISDLFFLDKKFSKISFINLEVYVTISNIKAIFNNFLTCKGAERSPMSPGDSQLIFIERDNTYACLKIIILLESRINVSLSIGEIIKNFFRRQQININYFFEIYFA